MSNGLCADCAFDTAHLASIVSIPFVPLNRSRARMSASDSWLRLFESQFFDEHLALRYVRPCALAVLSLPRWVRLPSKSKHHARMW